MKPNHSNHLLRASLGAALAMGLAQSAHAADGTWTQPTSGGLWSDTANWSGGTVADGSSFAANFNTLNLTADHTVHLDGDRTLTSLIFGDTNTATAGSWILDNNTISTNNLILAGTTPTITVNALGTGKTATISAIIEGTAGFTKSGVGTLNLSGANTYSGITFIGQGTLAFGADQTLDALTLGSSAGSTDVVSLDLSAASATFAGAAIVRTNSATANTVTIGSGKTLTMNGGLRMGYDALGGTGATASNLTAIGSGVLAIGGTTITIGFQQAASNAIYWSTATLDLTALGSGGTGFSTNVTNFNIGVSADSKTHDVGTVLLSNVANTLLATNLTVGQTGTSNRKGSSSLVLGTGTNVLQVDTLTVGSGKATGLVQFASQTAGSNGTVSISNKAGTGAANIVIADNSSNETTSGTVSGILDLRGHVATVNAGSVRIGKLAMGSNTGNSNGTLSFDAGTFTVDTLNMAPKTGNGTGTANATVIVGGGSFTVNTAFTLGSRSSGSGASVATLNLTGGLFTSNVDILDGGGATTSTINLDGGTLDLTGRAIGSATVAIDALNFNSGTLKNVSQINNGAGLTKATGGTLILDGTNTYTGVTNVSAGKLSVASTGTITSDVIIGTASTLSETEFNYNNSTTALSNSVSFASGSTGGILSGTGTITPAVTVTTGNRQTAGTSVTLSNPTATLGTETFGSSIDYQAGSIFEWNLTANATTTGGTRGINYDAVDTVSLLNTGADAIFRVVLNDIQNFSESFWNADRTWADIFKNAGTALNIETIFGTGSTVEYYNSAGVVANANTTGRSFSISGTTLTWSAVPEPSSALAGLLLATGLLRRRRNG